MSQAPVYFAISSVSKCLRTLTLILPLSTAYHQVRSRSSQPLELEMLAFFLPTALLLNLFWNNYQSHVTFHRPFHVLQFLYTISCQWYRSLRHYATFGRLVSVGSLMEAISGVLRLVSLRKGCYHARQCLVGNNQRTQSTS
ncbi:uncharacterized protein LY89DRAFT_689573 [Mollisia scopiformis]|uniref:Uncharacterized protein n=1 Tax=Mollisia scopiformis TaxID=149040 RepID=A0A132BCX6_MOLSC|nr:uncharacterized protein LY89DRAFT_689573 [Mollisia scopiformis]KUJ10282.1 hypothetical protein LY89DRAFT_689573 [Mollisia scopiformis]